MRIITAFLMLCVLAAVLPPLIQLVWEFLTGERDA